MNWNYGEQPDPVTIVTKYGQKIATVNVLIAKNDTDNEGEYRWLSITLPPAEWNRSILVNEIIRLYYPADKVEALINNYLDNPAGKQEVAEFETFQEWRRYAKSLADSLLEYARTHIVKLQESIAAGGTPEDLEPTPKTAPAIHDVMSQVREFVGESAGDLPDEEAAQTPALFPAWGNLIGQQVAEGLRLWYDGDLYKVRQPHTVQKDWTPDTAASLYVKVAASAEEGTIDNPIQYSVGMELVQGKYYSENGVTYLCIRSLDASYWELSALVGNYVTIV